MEKGYAVVKSAEYQYTLRLNAKDFKLLKLSSK